MSKGQHIDRILRNWEFKSDYPIVRIVEGSDGREVLQMRIDLGLLQLEMEGRPDGTKPGDADTYFDYIREQAGTNGDEFSLSEQQCVEIDREFVQFYHRRICWLQLRYFDRAVRDADHTLKLMDFCRQFSPEEQWTVSHEQYRPFVLFHRTQAAALAALEDKDGPEEAVEAINEGLDSLKELFVEYEAEDHFDEDELVKRLVEMREELREKYEVGRTLHEQLGDAIAAEEYERAAKIRDELARRGSSMH